MHLLAPCALYLHFSIAFFSSASCFALGILITLLPWALHLYPAWFNQASFALRADKIFFQISVSQSTGNVLKCIQMQKHFFPIRISQMAKLNLTYPKITPWFTRSIEAKFHVCQSKTVGDDRHCCRIIFNKCAIILKASLQKECKK